MPVNHAREEKMRTTHHWTFGRRAALSGAIYGTMIAAASAVDFSSRTQESVFIRTNANNTTIAESNLQVLVPSTNISPFIVPNGDTDIFNVLFTSRAELRNASASVPTLNNDDVLKLQAQAVNNTTGAVINMHPAGPADFASSNSPGAHALSWTVSLPTGSWTIRIVSQLLDRAPAGAVSALIGHWTMKITRYN